MLQIKLFNTYFSYMKNWKLDRIGSIGFIITAIFSPCCFPLFGIGLTALGYGSFELFGGWTMYVFQGFLLISLVGLFTTYLKRRNPYPLMAGLAGTILVFYSYYLIDADYWTYLMYTGMFLVFLASLYNAFGVKQQTQPDLILASTITCPQCGHQTKEEMPTNACQYFYNCPNCHARLQPKQGDCCVFCSYGNVVCPPMQHGENCCD